jgi:sRNA-binding regulator protein Hfq
LIKLVTGEKLRVWIEYYDRNMLRLTRQDQPNLFIYKQQIAYVAEESK